MQENFLLPLIIALPLLGFVLLGLFGKRFGEPAAGWLASLLVLGSFLLGLFLLLQGGAKWTLAEWLPGIPFSLNLDNLSGVMLMVVAGVGFLIHVWAIGYMHGDPGYSRFFSYFNLFIAAMLVLVLGDSLPVVFIGWEGVGLASYLLIGFWYQERVNADSARKAFIVNRIGDLGFLLAMGLLWSMFGTLSISELVEKVEAGGYSFTTLTLAGFFLLIGAIGKSAQVPLMVWLPDAMAGPTPVSALIHAATMVTAGVYLLVRHAFILHGDGFLAGLIVAIGLLTAFYGALCSLGQWDIKRIVAYTTLSQLGFMFVAVGVGAYWVAIFHIVTHAFFKALMFMTSGSVIHALGGEQDVRQMGGMQKYLPATHLHGLVAAFASGGLVPLAGFWSKDAILAYSFEFGPWLWALMLLASVLAALYSIRWYVLVFWGDYRGKAHPHESPAVMLWPNHILMGGALGVGFIGLPYVIDYKNFIEPFLTKAIGDFPHEKLPVVTEWVLIIISAVVAIAALWWGFRFFQQKMPAWYERFQTAALQGFYADAVYNALLVNPAKGLAELLFGGDRGLLSGFASLGSLMGGLGALLARLETGALRFYLAGLLLALVLLVGWGVLR
ncbi:MAG: NADH-quinone oxidoreductase subunit 12 [Meiothermus sp.]|uniref:NADH-quinone oxidoreductase subunit 12 n=2 Tax=Meiothermus hypogaeus TaxID=884155 RepID=A0A511QZJ0_9DEIN|nr:NADH-quinone oxidoreductase subunit L [Meiothermus hypogaeus]RIH80737.1 NADH-quinone oxidoreductase subunit 12 [Meiothermus hypogaeus]GEM82803.1 NADH-quinone oxidoreductase subunit 12 [Meiothermus hypogaeus NBRC 106114]GIW37776.1 MAG: NADH-quinone oxidoreductase subunit 12 [Meiothermus sp.]